MLVRHTQYSEAPGTGTTGAPPPPQPQPNTPSEVLLALAETKKQLAQLAEQNAALSAQVKAAQESATAVTAESGKLKERYENALRVSAAREALRGAGCVNLEMAMLAIPLGELAIVGDTVDSAALAKAVDSAKARGPQLFAGVAGASAPPGAPGQPPAPPPASPPSPGHATGQTAGSPIYTPLPKGTGTKELIGALSDPNSPHGPAAYKRAVDAGQIKPKSASVPP